MVLRFNYPALMGRSKNRTYRSQITEITEALMTFLKENNLMTLEPFQENGEVKEDLVLYSSDLNELGNLLFKEYFPKWSAYIDRGGDPRNTGILEKGLDRLKSK